jgi:hypothetical protein
VTYFDFRSNTPAAGTLPTDFWFTQSSDGVTWTERRIDGPFDLRTAPNANGLFVGDYMGLAARGSQFVSFYATTNGIDTANRTDVRVAFVDESAGTVAKRDATHEVAAGVAPLAMDEALAARIDAAVKAVMQRRLPAWESPERPLGGTPGEFER